MCVHIHRRRDDIKHLQRAGIGTFPAEALLARMQDKVDNFAPSMTISKVKNVYGCRDTPVLRKSFEERSRVSASSDLRRWLL